MTQRPNEYQDAEQWLLERFKGETVCEGHPLHTIGKALQAGAEGRILPKLPKNYQFLRSAIGVGLKGKSGFEYYFAEPPAEAMQDAIDKIGGSDARP